jgi:hypothetical protein
LTTLLAGSVDEVDEHVDVLAIGAVQPRSGVVLRFRQVSARLRLDPLRTLVQVTGDLQHQPRAAFGAVAATPVEAFEFDAPAVRACCESDPGLGYQLHQRVTQVLAKRLQATRIRLIARTGYSAAVH